MLLHTVPLGLSGSQTDLAQPSAKTPVWRQSRAMLFSRFIRLALILGLLSAIGPFAIDMYLPALPDIGRSLGASVGAVQWSLTTFFL